MYKTGSLEVIFLLNANIAGRYCFVCRETLTKKWINSLKILNNLPFLFLWGERGVVTPRLTQGGQAVLDSEFD